MRAKSRSKVFYLRTLHQKIGEGGWISKAKQLDQVVLSWLSLSPHTQTGVPSNISANDCFVDVCPHRWPNSDPFVKHAFRLAEGLG